MCDAALPAGKTKDLAGMSYPDMLKWLKRVAPQLVVRFVSSGRRRLKRVFVDKRLRRAGRRSCAAAKAQALRRSAGKCKAAIDGPRRYLCVYVGSTAKGTSRISLLSFQSSQASSFFHHSSSR